MALSPADFAAYSRATGTPYPETPEERAQMVPEVRAFRAGQLKQRESGDENNLLTGIGIGLGLLGAAGVGGLALRGRLPKQDTSGKSRVQQRTNPPADQVKDVRPSKVATEPQPDNFTKTSGNFVSDVEAGRNPQRDGDFSGLATKDSGFRQFSERADDITGRDEVLNLIADEQEQAMRTRMEPQTFLDEQITTLTDTYEAIGEPAAQAQNIDAVQSAADQADSFLEKAIQRDTDSVREGKEAVFTERMVAERMQGPSRRSDLNYTNLKAQGLSDFEINARMQEYANTGEIRLLDPTFNAKTVGLKEFQEALNITDAVIDKEGNILSGVLLNPEGEVRRSFRGSRSPVLETKDGDFDPTAEIFGVPGASEVVSTSTPDLTTRPQGVSASSNPEEYKTVQEKLLSKSKAARVSREIQNEQYKKAINDFGVTWDTLVDDPLSGVSVPRRERRVVDAYDLDIPTRIESDPKGNLFATKLYRDQLDSEIVSRIERGERIELDVPFLVNKERAIQDAEEFGGQMPELRAKANKYIETGTALGNVYQEVVGDLGENPYTTLTFDPGNYFTTLEGTPTVTPGFGKGSQKGGFVGGVPERQVPEPIYNIEYQPYVTAAGKKTMIPKAAYVSPNTGETIYTDVNFDVLDQTDPRGNPLYLLGETKVNSDMVATQPIKVTRFLSEEPVGEVEKTSRKGNKFMADVFEATEEIIQAPLQVTDTEGNVISYQGQVSRSEMANALNEAKKNVTERRRRAQYEAGRLSGKVKKETDDLVNKQIISQDQADAINAFQKKAFDLSRKQVKPLTAKQVQSQLAAEKGIKLPVLESPTASEFVDSFIGTPRDVPSIRKLVTTTNKLGETKIFPVNQKELEEAQKANLMPKRYKAYTQDPSLPRRPAGPTNIQDISLEPKDTSGKATAERVGYGDEDFETTYSYDPDRPQTAYMGSVELGSARRAPTSAAYPAKPLYTGGPSLIVKPSTGYQFTAEGPRPYETYRTSSYPKINEQNQLVFSPPTGTVSVPRTLRTGANPGTAGQEMTAVRQSMAEVKPKRVAFIPLTTEKDTSGKGSIYQNEPFFHYQEREDLPGVDQESLENAMKNLLAQTSRRSGKRGNY